jgi:hypothetical protein
MVLTPGGTTGNGTNENQFRYNDTKGNKYWRKVDAAFNDIVHDREGGSLALGPSHPWGVPTTNVQSVANLGGSFRLPGGRHGKYGQVCCI